MASPVITVIQLSTSVVPLACFPSAIQLASLQSIVSHPPALGQLALAAAQLQLVQAAARVSTGNACWSPLELDEDADSLALALLLLFHRLPSTISHLAGLGFGTA